MGGRHQASDHSLVADPLRSKAAFTPGARRRSLPSPSSGPLPVAVGRAMDAVHESGPAAATGYSPMRIKIIAF
jgi:hypothetical protein